MRPRRLASRSFESRGQAGGRPDGRAAAEHPPRRAALTGGHERGVEDQRAITLVIRGDLDSTSGQFDAAAGPGAQNAIDLTGPWQVPGRSRAGPGRAAGGSLGFDEPVVAPRSEVDT